MSTSLLQGEINVSLVAGPNVTAPGLLVELTKQNEAETLRFLAVRPIHTVFMSSIISDNGVASPLNRGAFYGYRNHEGQLEGVALIGHATLIETERPECIEAFARFARRCSPTHLIRGEQEKVESFWNYYSDTEQAARLVCREFLLRRQTIPTNVDVVPGLRQATAADLEMVITANDSMACQENGTSPLAKDSAGFRERSIRRIRQGRVWVVVENNQLLFKTDIIAQTPQAAYLEGVYVDPGRRGKGFGLKCVRQLTEYLLMRVGSLCLTVNEKFPRALTFYERAGFDIASRYDTIYLQR
ncbi:MAG: GNAT family N-acetyltransferase [Pyrinomonadaceae bacterium]|nr:GNAT family N-acetyltransferase [Pyrinomonadaceae bacterium]